MLETLLAISQGFEKDELGTYTFKFGEGYELALEPLIFDEQWYVALYQNEKLLIPKFVVRIGKK